MASHSGQDIATAYVQILPSTDGMKKNLKEALSGSLSGASKELEGTLGGITKVGAAAVGAATGAVGGFFKSAVNEGMDFDSAMSQVAATMGSTMEEMSSEVGTVDTAWGTFSGNLREYAQYMGENTAWSATQAAEALNYMALAGYDAQTSMEMLPNVLNLASAGGFDLARASDMITDTQTAFGISLERTNQLVDEMAKAASTGNTSVEQLGDAFLVVGGLTQELNGGMVQLKDGSYASVDGVQELEIALTAMANAGIKGSEAGTHMRNMLLKLSSPTSEGTVALEKMGVSVFDTEGKMRSLSDVFGDLSYAMASMTQEEKIQTISDLFNTRDIASAEALLNAVSQDWDNIGASILDAQGAAQQMADTQLDNLAGDVTLFQSKLSQLKITLADQLAPSLRQFVQAASDGIGQAITKLQEYFSSDIGQEKLQGITTALQGVLDAILNNLDPILDGAIGLINGVASAIEWLVSHFDVAASGLKVVAGAWVGLKALNVISSIATVVTSVTGLIGVISSIGPAIGAVAAFVTGPIGMIVTAVAGAAALIAANWDTVKEWGIKAWEGIKGAWNAAGEFFSGVRQKITDKFQDIGSWFSQKFTQAREGIQNAWSNVTSFFSNVGQGIVNVFSNLPSTFATIGSNIMNGLKNGITNAASAVINGVKNIASNIANAVTSFFGISSPSKLFAEYGRFLDEGLADGISSNMSLPISELRKTASAMEAEASISVGNTVSTQAVTAGVAEAREITSDPRVTETLDKILQALSGMGVYIDGDTIAGKIAPRLNNEFGITAYHESREVAYA